MSHIFQSEGAAALFKYGFQNDSPPSDFYLRLMSSEGVEIPDGNGYDAGGVAVTFTGLTTGSNYAQIKVSRTEFICDGGEIPRYGVIRYADLTDDAGTCLARFDIGADIIVPSNKQLAITNATIRVTKVTTTGATFTINGLEGLLQWTFQQTGAPSTFYLALLTPESAVGETLGACQEIPSGNGYTAGGVAVARSTSGFVSLSTTWEKSVIEIAQKIYDTAGGQIPCYGTAYKIALTGDGSPVSSREVYAVFDFDEPVVAPNGKLILVENASMQINEN